MIGGRFPECVKKDRLSEVDNGRFYCGLYFKIEAVRCSEGMRIAYMAAGIEGVSPCPSEKGWE